MGNLIRMPHSELHATIEVLDALGVEPGDFERIRRDRQYAARVAESFKTPQPTANTAVVPADGVEFELEVDDDRDPMEVVTFTGFAKTGWEYLGPTLTGKKTYHVKLVRLGHVRNRDEAEEKANKLGYRLLEGQARESFKRRFPTCGDGSLIIFGGSEWKGQAGDEYESAGVASIYEDGEVWGSDFSVFDYDFDDDCFWAVVSKDA